MTTAFQQNAFQTVAVAFQIDGEIVPAVVAGRPAKPKRHVVTLKNGVRLYGDPEKLKRFTFVPQADVEHTPEYAPEQTENVTERVAAETAPVALSPPEALSELPRTSESIQAAQRELAAAQQREIARQAEAEAELERQAHERLLAAIAAEQARIEMARQAEQDDEDAVLAMMLAFTS